MYCLKCGSKLDGIDKKCTNCGYEVKKETAETKEIERLEITKEININVLKEVEKNPNFNKKEEKNNNYIVIGISTIIIILLIIVLIIISNNKKSYLMTEEKMIYCNDNYESKACGLTKDSELEESEEFEIMDFTNYNFSESSSRQAFYESVINILKTKQEDGNNYCNEENYTFATNKLNNTLKSNYSYLCGLDVTYLENLIIRLNQFYIQNNIQENIVDAYVVGRGGRNEYANYSGETIGSNGTYTAYLRRVHMSSHLFNDYDKLKKTYERDLQKGYHPKNSTPEDIIVHEIAHALDFHISARRNNINSLVIEDFSKYNQFYISWGEQTYAKEVVEKASAKVNENYKANNLPTKTEEELRTEISGYAASTKNGTIMYAETFAEALVDYLSNGSNASDLSIEIYKIVQEDLKKI